MESGKALPGARRLNVGGIGLRKAGAVAAYALLAILVNALFVFLHYLGNQIPYDLAAQRFAADAKGDRPDAGHRLGFKSRFEYCQIGLTVLGGARTEGTAQLPVETGELRRAIVPEIMTLGDGTYCEKLDALADGATSEERRWRLKTRYWWGQKALWGIALRYVSVADVRQWTMVATYVAYGLLALALWALSPRALAVVAPLVVLGPLLSGIPYWSDIANGTPYLWTVAAAAALCLLVRRGRWARPACFAMGMASCYLWLGDGHAFLAIAWIGLIAYFGGDQRPSRAALEAAVCVVAYLAGFLVSYVIGATAKELAGAPAWADFWRAVFAVADETTTEGALSWERHIEDNFHMIAGRSNALLHAGEAFALSALLAPLAALALMVRAARAPERANAGAWRLGGGLVFLLGLAATQLPQFMIAEHVGYRTPRFLFVPIGLFLSGLILIGMRDRRAALLGAAFSAAAVSAWLGFERADVWAVDHRAEHVRHSMRVLRENAAKADVVYVSNGSIPYARIYHGAESYRYGDHCTWGSAERCIRELRDLPYRPAGRTWLVLVHNGGAAISEQLAAWTRAGLFERRGAIGASLYRSVPGIRMDQLPLAADAVPALPPSVGWREISEVESGRHQANGA